MEKPQETDATADGLKPCPFCDGAPVAFFESSTYHIECEECEFSILRPVDEFLDDRRDLAEDDAKATWNRRADTAIPDTHVVVPREPLKKLAAITSVPSMELTIEQGWVILDVVQKELLTAETRAMIAASEAGE